uniref:Cadherin domain-containing protein n=1 Tax=Timema monikensis TaxID=170555 RepID=A0A7R9E6X8_9NEOP|nr:unnamed protein product [Timema monikensis]
MEHHWKRGHRSKCMQESANFTSRTLMNATSLFSRSARLEAKVINGEAKIFRTRLDGRGTRNSHIYYSIVSGDPYKNFTIDSILGILQPATPVDFEELTAQSVGPKGPGFRGVNVRPISLTVEARDHGKPSLASRVEVVVYVQDVNDHMPQFEHASYKQSIQEDLPGGTSVLQVQAWDGDGSSPNNAIVYRIQQGAEDKFVIDAETGVISVAIGANLDPDRTEPKTTLYTLSVLALDGGVGAEQFQNAVDVKITIVDVNNKAPIFIDPGTIRVRENTQVHHVAFLVQIHRRSITSRFWYKYIAGPSHRVFGTNTSQVHHVTFPPPLYTQLILLRITNTSRVHHIAFLVQIHRMSITSRFWYKYIAGPSRRVSPTSLHTANPTPYYKYIACPSHRVFGTNTSHVHHIAFLIPGKLETLPPPKGSQLTVHSYWLYVRVGLTVCREGEETRRDGPAMCMQCDVGKYVHNIRAVDPDEKPLLRYRISPENSEARNEEGTIVKSSEYDYVHMFDLNPMEGHLRVVKLIDRERVETIRLGLVVEDLAAVKKKQVTTAMLTIIIEDENDNNPKFRRPFYRRSITENSKNGVTIINVVADDADKNRTIKYALEDIKYSGRYGVLSMGQGLALFSSRLPYRRGPSRHTVPDGPQLVLSRGRDTQEYKVGNANKVLMKSVQMSAEW